MKKSLTLLIAVVVVSLVITPVVGATDSDGDLVPDAQDKYPNRNDLKYGGTLVIGTYDKPETMDTLRTSVGAWQHMLISEPPIAVSPLGGNRTKMGWIESYDITPDEKTLTLHIKKGVTLHDGTPLNAETYGEIMKNRKKKADMYSLPLRNVPLENITVLDKYSLKIKMTKWTPGFYPELQNESWFGGVGTPNAIERYGKSYGSTEVYGNGPFKFKEWVRGDHITFERFEDYTWAPGFAANPGPAYLDKVIAKIIPEEISMIEMLKSGEVDAIRQVPASKVEKVKKLEGYNVWERSRHKLFYIEYNTRKSPLDEVKVRQALNYAINKKAITEKIFYGTAAPAYNFYLDKAFEEPGTTHMYHYSVEKAEGLLDEAGWSDEDGDGIREKNGKELKFKLWTRLSTYYKKIGIVAQAAWREIGVKAEVKHFDYNALKSQINKGEHEAVVWHHAWPYIGGMVDWWLGSPEKYPYPFMAGLNTSKEKALSKKLKNSKNQAQFLLRARDMVNYVTEMAIGAPIVYPMSTMVFSEEFMNVVPRTHANRIMPFLHDVYSKEVYYENLNELQSQ